MEDNVSIPSGRTGPGDPLRPAAPVDAPLGDTVDERRADLTDVASLDAAMTRGEISATSLCETALSRAARSEGVFITVTHERAEREARAADERLASGRRRGALDGVSVAVKDMFDVTGTVTTAGSATRLDLPSARRDAAVVSALARAGAVLIGKTSLSEFAFSGLGVNPALGTPFLRAGAVRVAPGGSSSGSAAAVANGVVAVAAATDTSGSARIPAAFFGVVGFKASEHRYLVDGLLPLAPTLDSVGWIGRTVGDVALVDEAVTRIAPAARASGVPLTLVVPAGELHDGADAQVRARFDTAVARLRDDGHRVHVRSLPVLAEAQRLLDTHATIVEHEAFAQYGAVLACPLRSQVDPGIVRRLERYVTSGRTALVLYRALPSLRRQLRRELGDAWLLCPTVRHTAPPLAPLLTDPDLYDATNRSTLRTTMLLSYLGMPGVSIPLLRVGAPPVGLLLSGPENSDTALLAAARKVETALTGHRPD